MNSSSSGPYAASPSIHATASVTGSDSHHAQRSHMGSRRGTAAAASRRRSHTIAQIAMIASPTTPDPYWSHL